MVYVIERSLAIALVVGLSVAFAPVSHRTAFLGRSLVSNSPVAADSTTALSMNLFDRFSRVAKSNLNSILQKLEDPEKIMNQAVEDMQVRGVNAFLQHLLRYSLNKWLRSPERSRKGSPVVR